MRHQPHPVELIGPDGNFYGTTSQGGASDNGTIFRVRLGAAPYFHRGDPNADGTVDISDAITTLGFLFLGNPLELACRDAADANDDGDVDVSDAIWTLTFKFLGGVEIPAPGQDTCGIDPTTDGLPICSYDPTKC